MKEKTKKEKQGLARLFELAGARKNKLTLACLLSVLPPRRGLCRFSPSTAWWWSCWPITRPQRRQTRGKFLPSVPLPSARRWSMASALTLPQRSPHTAAYEIIYELRLQLMEKLSPYLLWLLLPAPPRGPSKRLSLMTPTRLKRFWPTICARSLRR